MDQRAVVYPARSVDIRITVPQCGDQMLYWQVERALEAMKERLDWNATERGSFDIPAQDWRPAINVEWVSAAVIDPPEPDLGERSSSSGKYVDPHKAGEFVEPPGGGIPYLHVPDTEEAMMARLTDAERAALENQND